MLSQESMLARYAIAIQRGQIEGMHGEMIVADDNCTVSPVVTFSTRLVLILFLF
jgi:hypothetical protein